jgi:ribokinase
MDALAEAGVNTDYIKILEQRSPEENPDIAIITVDKTGSSQIVALPGASNGFGPDDVDEARELFTQVADSQGSLVLTLECLFETVVYAVKIANELGIKIMLDPGGVREGSDLDMLLRQGVYLLKPNEHEAKILTGITVTDFASAEQAARKIMERGVEVVLITHGEHGAYLFSAETKLHITVPKLDLPPEKDATGCGDQTMATLCAKLQSGASLEEAAKIAVLSGTLQFHRVGIQPVSNEDLAAVS